MTTLEPEHTDLPWGGDGHLLLHHRTFPRKRREKHQNLRPFVSFQDCILSLCSINTHLRPPQWQTSETFGTHTFQGISFAASDCRMFFAPQIYLIQHQFKPISGSDHLSPTPALTEQDKSFDSKLHTIPLKNPSAVNFVMNYIRCASNRFTIYTFHFKPKG